MKREKTRWAWWWTKVAAWTIVGTVLALMLLGYLMSLASYK